MRFVLIPLMFAVLATLAGCGANVGSGEPVQMTAEQIQELNNAQKEAQKEVDVEERAHTAGMKAPQEATTTAEDEERMHRRGR